MRASVRAAFFFASVSRAPCPCSKAEYVRCVALGSPSLVYVATNQGLLFQVHLHWGTAPEPQSPQQPGQPEPLKCHWVRVDTSSLGVELLSAEHSAGGATNARGATGARGGAQAPADKGPVVDLQLLPARRRDGPCSCATPSGPQPHVGSCHALALAWGTGHASALHLCTCLPQSTHAGRPAKRPLWHSAWPAQGSRQLLNVFLCSALGPRSEGCVFPPPGCPLSAA